MPSFNPPEPPPEGELVGLRRWEPGDADLLAAGWGDPDVARWSAVPADTSPAAARRWIAGWEERRLRGLALDLVVVELATAAAVGEVGVAVVDPRRRAGELGFWLLPAARGRGLAGEAVALACRWLAGTAALDVVFARCAPANAAAARTLAVAGFERIGRSSAGEDLWRPAPR